jgi:hypothetical protein
MEIRHDDEDTVDFLDEAGMSFMALLVHELNGVLKDNGMKSPQKRQEACASFLFNFAYNLDAGWFVQGDTKLFPKVCLAERAEPAEGQNLGAITTLHVPTAATSWHEYAHGVVSGYFDDDEEAAPDVRTGSYGNED